ncbi:MAG: NAD(P)H-binding protein [Labilithrix sp.]|nr:NAD(P)H-binding protein [Labilithrix sp.]MCW5811491.1 NAD(P)H-binding protein [Labilithrix sp.]
MAKNIVVTGATGNIGRRVVEGLAAKKAPVVALVRDAAKGESLAALGAKVALGSFEDRASLERAFVEADTVVLITPANARAAEQTLAAIDAAKKTGVRKIVRISALKASPDGPTDNTRQHGRTEAALLASGLAYVVLRPHLFLQNLFASLPTILGQGQIYFGVGDGKMGMIDTRDVADAAIVAATTDTFDRSVLELTGPASIDYHAVAAAVSRGLGKPVAYVPVPPQAAADAMRAMGADDWTAGVIHDYCAAYASGWGDFTTNEVERITGHAPRSVDDFVREVLAAQR